MGRQQLRSLWASGQKSDVGPAQICQWSPTSRRPKQSRMASVPCCLRRGLRRATHRELPANALPGVRSPLASHVTTGTSEVPSVKQQGTESTGHGDTLADDAPCRKLGHRQAGKAAAVGWMRLRSGRKQSRHCACRETGEFARGLAPLPVVDVGLQPPGGEG